MEVAHLHYGDGPREPIGLRQGVCDLRKLATQRLDHKREGCLQTDLHYHSTPVEARFSGRIRPYTLSREASRRSLDSRQMLTMGNIKLTRSIWGLLRTHRGSDRSTRSKVEEIQRSRILGAMAEEVAIRGASSVTVARVIARAGVSRRLFYEQFADIEDCFLATFDWAVEQAGTAAVEAYTAEKCWQEGTRAGLAALLRFFDEQPLLAQLCVVHAAGGGPRVLEHRSRVIVQLCEVVDLGRAESLANRVPGPVVAEGVVGAVLAVLYTRLLARGADYGQRLESSQGESPLIEMHGELMSLIVLPYLGASVARKVGQVGAPIATPGGAHRAIAIGPSGARRTRRSPDISHGARAQGDRRASGRQQPRSGRTRGHRRPGSDLEDPHPFGISGSRGESRRQRRAAGTPNSWWLTEAAKRSSRNCASARPASPIPGASQGKARARGALADSAAQAARITIDRDTPPGGASVRRYTPGASTPEPCSRRRLRPLTAAIASEVGNTRQRVVRASGLVSRA